MLASVWFYKHKQAVFNKNSWEYNVGIRRRDYVEIK